MKGRATQGAVWRPVLPLMTRDFDYWIRREDIERFNAALLPLDLHSADARLADSAIDFHDFNHDIDCRAFAGNGVTLDGLGGLRGL